MLQTLFSEAAASADLRHRERIERAKDAKGVDRATLRLQRNAQFHDRLVRASLDVKPRQPITQTLMALTVACPEALLHHSHRLGWGPAREQPAAENPAPSLLERYQRELRAGDFSFAGSGGVENDITPKGPIKEVLLCHGLSPTPDTILLLADIGRSARITHSLGLTRLRVMLADVSWTKHNRSVARHFAHEDDYVNNLRICQDNRFRIYKALDLDCDVFNISAHLTTSGISRPRLQEASAPYRELAQALWTEQALESHTVEMRALIGQTFNGIKQKNASLLSGPLAALLKFPEFGSALETSLKKELQILRTLSELFSSFDEDVFVYYFAQFYAQNSYRNFLKVAVESEKKFDSYFDLHFEQFQSFASQGSSGKITRGRRQGAKPPMRRYVYFPQYKQSDLDILPYSSLSLDIAKSDNPQGLLTSKAILLRDCGGAKAALHLQKIRSVLADTPLGSRNRLLSDLLSFAHLLVSRVTTEAAHDGPLARAIEGLGRGIHLDMYSPGYNMTDYPTHFADWLTAIDKEDSVLPFHLKPFTWDEASWEDGMLDHAASFIFELLMSIRRICD